MHEVIVYENEAEFVCLRYSGDAHEGNHDKCDPQTQQDGVTPNYFKVSKPQPVGRVLENHAVPTFQSAEPEPRKRLVLPAGTLALGALIVEAAHRLL